MAASTRDTTKRKRPPQTGTAIMLRLQPEQLAKLDQWVSVQAETLSRPEAVRRLIDLAIDGDEFSKWDAAGKLG